MRPETGKNLACRNSGSYRLRRLLRDVQAKMRDPEFFADLRRQARLMADHPKIDSIDDGIEAIVDWDDWPPFDAS